MHINFGQILFFLVLKMRYYKKMHAHMLYSEETRKLLHVKKKFDIENFTECTTSIFSKNKAIRKSGVCLEAKIYLTQAKYLANEQRFRQVYIIPTTFISIRKYYIFWYHAKVIEICFANVMYFVIPLRINGIFIYFSFRLEVFLDLLFKSPGKSLFQRNFALGNNSKDQIYLLF